MITADTDKTGFAPPTGFWLYLATGTLYSGPPHNYSKRAYGPPAGNLSLVTVHLDMDQGAPPSHVIIRTGPETRSVHSSFSPHFIPIPQNEVPVTT